MYLSRLQLNNHNQQLWRTIIGQPHQLHQLVMKGFPDSLTRAQANILHRLEQEAGQVTLLVQSDIKPNWTPIPADLLLPYTAGPNPALRQMDGLTLPNGRFLQFRLRANPTKRLSRGKGNKPGPRVQLVRQEAQLAWLERKAAQSGFQLLDLHISPEGKQTDTRKKITIYTILVNGRLRITDSHQFQQALRQGIGPAKAFGCGLLSLAPV